jgi:hypothetical protein
MNDSGARVRSGRTMGPFKVAEHGINGIAGAGLFQSIFPVPVVSCAFGHGVGLAEVKVSRGAMSQDILWVTLRHEMPILWLVMRRHL